MRRVLCYSLPANFLFVRGVLNTLELLKFVNGVYFIYAERAQLEELAKKHPVKEPRVDPSK